jgi:hypothetical protein
MNPTFFIFLLIQTIYFSSCVNCLANGEQHRASEVLSNISQKFKVEHGSILLTTKHSGARFLFSIEDGESLVTQYNQQIVLPRGFTKAQFAERHFSFTFIRKSNIGWIYELRQSFDARSFGGELE